MPSGHPSDHICYTHDDNDLLLPMYPINEMGNVRSSKEASTFVVSWFEVAIRLVCLLYSK